MIVDIIFREAFTCTIEIRSLVIGRRLPNLSHTPLRLKAEWILDHIIFSKK